MRSMRGRPDWLQPSAKLSAQIARSSTAGALVASTTRPVAAIAAHRLPLGSPIGSGCASGLSSVGLTLDRVEPALCGDGAPLSSSEALTGRRRRPSGAYRLQRGQSWSLSVHAVWDARGRYRETFRCSNRGGSQRPPCWWRSRSPTGRALSLEASTTSCVCRLGGASRQRRRLDSCRVAPPRWHSRGGPSCRGRGPTGSRNLARMGCAIEPSNVGAGSMPNGDVVELVQCPFEPVGHPGDVCAGRCAAVNWHDCR